MCLSKGLDDRSRNIERSSDDNFNKTFGFQAIVSLQESEDQSGYGSIVGPIGNGGA